MHSALRPCVTAGIAFIGAGIVVATPVASPPPDVCAVRLTSSGADPTTVALLLGSSGVSIYSQAAVDFVNTIYIQPKFPGAISQPLGAPQQLYPVVATHNGFFDPSVQAGVAILDDAIREQLAEGSHVVVFGASQGATIESLEMENLAALPPADQPTPGELAFVLVGDPNLPNGGMFERFDFAGLPGNVTIPSLGLTFSGATPADTPYPTIIYTAEYDGAADFPRYPVDLLADANALLGLLFVHEVSYAEPSLVDQAFVWQPSPGYVGDTTYYLMPTPDLPLLDPLRAIPVVGAPLADLLQPDVTVLVNLGYGPDNVGYSEYPNLATPAGLVPAVNPATVLGNLAAGTQEGVHDFVADLGGRSTLATTTLPTIPSIVVDITSAPSPHAALGPGELITVVQELNTVNTNALATVVAAPLDAFMPVVDIDVAGGITLPSYDVNLVLAGLGQVANGNPDGILDAIGYPVVGDAGLLTIAGFVDLLDGVNTTATVAGAIQGAVTADIDIITGLLP